MYVTYAYYKELISVTLWRLDNGQCRCVVGGRVFERDRFTLWHHKGDKRWRRRRSTFNDFDLEAIAALTSYHPLHDPMKIILSGCRRTWTSSLHICISCVPRTRLLIIFYHAIWRGSKGAHQGRGTNSPFNAYIGGISVTHAPLIFYLLQWLSSVGTRCLTSR